MSEIHEITKGIWRYDEDIAEVYTEGDDEDGPREVASVWGIADGRAISATKELLAVAERVVAGGMSFPKYERELAKAAIAKAKGEVAL